MAVLRAKRKRRNRSSRKRER